jgi:hypothetical protein
MHLVGCMYVLCVGEAEQLYTACSVAGTRHNAEVAARPCPHNHSWQCHNAYCEAPYYTSVSSVSPHLQKRHALSKTLGGEPRKAEKVMSIPNGITTSYRVVLAVAEPKMLWNHTLKKGHQVRYKVLRWL